jgi:hypothetical protein
MHGHRKEREGEELARRLPETTGTEETHDPWDTRKDWEREEETGEGETASRDLVPIESNILLIAYYIRCN